MHDSDWLGQHFVGIEKRAQAICCLAHICRRLRQHERRGFELLDNILMEIARMTREVREHLRKSLDTGPEEWRRVKIQLTKLAHDISNGYETCLQANYLLTSSGEYDYKWVALIQAAAKDLEVISRQCALLCSVAIGTPSRGIAAVLSDIVAELGPAIKDSGARIQRIFLGDVEYPMLLNSNSFEILKDLLQFGLRSSARLSGANEMSIRALLIPTDRLECHLIGEVTMPFFSRMSTMKNRSSGCT